MADLQHHLSGNVEQYCQRIKMRDDVDAPREVEHFADFRVLADARAAAGELEGLGWTVTVERRRVIHGSLKASRMAPVDVDTADALTEQVFAVVAAHRGSYDGWNAPIVA